MKKILSIMLLLVSVTLFSQEGKTSFSITAGTEYTEDFFVDFGFSVIRRLEGNKELDVKTSLNMRTEESNGDINPVFNIPVKIDINFLFPINDEVTFLAGTGLSPTIRLQDDDTGFLIGPNAKLGVRFKIHPSMSIFFEGCQSLLIGPPQWMYSSTEIVFGLNFFI
ncbi:MAG: hypothetical protein PF447_09085 [Spirochaetaceae bacterium]|jgi:hypothetical protein|nr:hypothetical protein [Spirochaetaceae bacterium]